MDTKSPQFLNTIALIVVILACTHMLGYIFDSRDLNNFGRAIGFAPLPIPFSAVDGYDSIAVFRTYEAFYFDGSHEQIDLKDSLSKIAEGPHRWKITFMQTLRFAPRISRPMVNSFLQFAICRTGVLDNIQRRSDLDHVEMTIRTLPETGKGLTWKYPVYCL